MKQLILGVGELGATRAADGVVKTFALGSCVAVILLDPKTHCIGMVHVALPESSISPERAKARPGHFADTGIPALLREMVKAGADANARGYIVKLVGGANVADPNNTFNIGKRNALAIKKVLWQHGMGAVAEDLGDRISRTVTVDAANGRVMVSSPARGQWHV